jgi:hypothetical protein
MFAQVGPGSGWQLDPTARYGSQPDLVQPNNCGSDLVGLS